MRRWPIALGVVLVAAGAAAVISGVTPSLRGRVPQSDLVTQYCVGCHNDAELAGGVTFQHLRPEQLAADADLGEAVVRKLRTGLMPPLGEPRPERTVLDGLAASLEAGLDAEWARAPNPGLRPLARLNRTEYANAIRDLLRYDATAIVSTLPPDASGEWFDNDALALGVSPTLLEGYATAAMQIGRRAVGDRTMGHAEVRYSATPGAAQRKPIAGLPLGTRGGLAVEHTFPLDAEYELAVSASIPAAGWDNPTGALVYCDGPAVDVTFNGTPVAADNPRRFRWRQRAVSRRGCARWGRSSADDHRPVRFNRCRRHAEPARDLRLPARLCSGRAAVRGANSRAACDARVSSARCSRQCGASGAHALLRARARGGR
jgi:hypothetical protein